jgi:Tol biopolymer transport system component
MLEDWSADGEQLLTLLWPDEERFQVALVSARDGEIQVLREWSETPLFVSCDLSPDGRYVACDLARENVPEERDIFVLPVGGGDPVPVVEGAGEDQLMGWAPDGRSLFFHSDRGLTEGIWMVPVTDGRASGDPVLLRGDVWRMEPIGFSRDAFFFGVTTQRLQVHTALVDLTGNRIVSPPFPVEDPSGAGGPLRTSSFGAWSGDGRYLAYFRFPRMFTYNPKLVIRSVSGDETRTIDVPLARVAGNRGWSADGNGILVNGVAPGDDRVGIFRIDLRSGTTRAIVYREDLEDAVSWTAVLSPDGRTLFYARRPEGSESGSWTSSMPFPVVARDLASGTERVIAVVTGLMSLVISPDGGTLAMQTFDRATRTFGIAVLPASGGEPRELHRAEDQMVGFTWTPDGRHLLGGTLAEGTSKLWKFDVRDGTTTPLAGTLEPGILGGLASLQIHPDGRHLTFESGEGRGEIWIVENLPGTGEAPYSP